MIRLIFGMFMAVTAGVTLADLPVDPSNQVAHLPSAYPDTWIFAHDTNFFAISDGKVIIVDVAAKNHNYKGSLGVGQFGSFLASANRSELYAAETFYSRRLHGKRTDAITIYDKVNLKPVDEIILPGGKRGQIVTYKNTMQFLNREKFILVFNFTPAASVSVVDMDKRKVVGEVPIPGCSMIYPTAKMSFASLCSDDRMLVSHLDSEGKLKSQKRTAKFFNADTDPLFAASARAGAMEYFPSFRGQLQPINMSGDKPEILPAWSLVSAAEKAENWRPGGWQVIAADSNGRLYVLMREHGFNGSHKDGGSEVWVFDTAGKKRVQRIPLKNWGVSVEVTRGSNPLLIVTNNHYDLDVYGAANGNWQRVIGGRAFEMPMILHAVK